MQYRSLFLIAAFTMLLGHAIAQTDTASQDIGSLLEQNQPKAATDYVSNTFKTTHLINGQTTETLHKGILDFRILHHFGRLDQGAGNFFGLDDATTKLALDYGITDWLMVGIAHSTYFKEDDGFIKLRLLRQADGRMPVSVTYNGDMSVQTGSPNPSIPGGDKYYFSNRMCYANQVLIARKFSDWLSVQIMPTIVHYNLVDSNSYHNNTYAIGIGGRIKVSRRIAITAEYYYRIPGTELPGYHNALSIGMDIETGGHVFQLFFTNSQGMTERTFIGQTTDDWGKGQIHFGFNISRVFNLVHPKEFKGTRNTIY